MASIPLDHIEHFFTMLADIHAQFLYIVTCYSTGQNLVEIQKSLQSMIKKQLDAQLKYELFEEKRVSRFEIGPSRPTGTAAIPYIIVLEVTYDIPAAMGLGNLHLFFDRLNDFLDDPAWGTHDISNVLISLGRIDQNRLPSIRYPGATTFFRPVDLGTMEIITWARLRALRFERDQKLAP